MIDRKCPHCNKYFEPRRTTHKYCTSKCCTKQQIANLKNPLKKNPLKCVKCHKIFTPHKITQTHCHNPCHPNKRCPIEVFLNKKNLKVSVISRQRHNFVWINNKNGMHE